MPMQHLLLGDPWDMQLFSYPAWLITGKETDRVFPFVSGHNGSLEVESSLSPVQLAASPQKPCRVRKLVVWSRPQVRTGGFSDSEISLPIDF